jgi:hypothetical protein
MTRHLIHLSLPRRAGSWRAAAVVIGAATLALVTACSSSPPAKSSSSGASAKSGTTSSSSSAAGVTPEKAITLAAAQTQQVNSLSGTMSVQIGSTTAANGTMQVQVRPTLLIGDNLSASSSGQSTNISEILTSTALYLDVPGLSGQTGQPWMEVPFSELSGSLGTALDQAIQEAESGDPLTQTQLLAVSKNVREVGTQVINGVSTTEYSGSLSPSAALNALSPSLSKELAPELKALSGDINWDVWLDSQHMVHKLVENETVDGQAATVTVSVTSENQPVTVSVPPSSQVYVLPASALSNSGL